jgi:hypothetical protein
MTHGPLDLLEEDEFFVLSRTQGAGRNIVIFKKPARHQVAFLHQFPPELPSS